MNIRFQAVKVATGEPGGDGLLVFTDEWLLALLVRLGAGHAEREGQWFLETGYGRFVEGEHPIFTDPNEAQAWFVSSLADKRIDDPWAA